MPVFLSQIQSLDEQTEGEQWLPSSGPMTENEFRLLFSESVCESDFPLVDDDGEFTTEAIDRLTNIAECTAERLFAERDAAVKRAEAAEAQLAAAGVRGTIEIIEGEPEDVREAKMRQITATVARQAYRDMMMNIAAKTPLGSHHSAYQNGVSAAREAAAWIASEADTRITELEQQLAEANARREAAHAALNRAESEHLKACAELDEANARAEAAERGLTIARERSHFWETQANERERWLQKAEARAADLAKAAQLVLREAGKAVGPRTLERHFQVFGTVAVQLTRAQIEKMQAALNPDTRQEGASEND
jgi:hypothetical protein